MPTRLGDLNGSEFAKIGNCPVAFADLTVCQPTPMVSSRAIWVPINRKIKVGYSRLDIAAIQINQTADWRRVSRSLGSSLVACS